MCPPTFESRACEKKWCVVLMSSQMQSGLTMIFFENMCSFDELQWCLRRVWCICVFWKEMNRCLLCILIVFEAITSWSVFKFKGWVGCNLISFAEEKKRRALHRMFLKYCLHFWGCMMSYCRRRLVLIQ